MATVKNYEELVKIQTMLREFPECARLQVRELWREVSQGYPHDVHQESARIAESFDLRAEDVEYFYDWYDASHPDRIVVFYSRAKWLNGDADCFDTRVDQEYLPKGSVVCGLIGNRGCMVDKPYMTNEQHENWLIVVQQALIDMWVLGVDAREVFNNPAIVY